MSQNVWTYDFLGVFKNAEMPKGVFFLFEQSIMNFENNILLYCKYGHHIWKTFT